MLNKILAKKYEIRREIGRGGMGVIYEALHAALNKKVAIKVLHAQFTGDTAFLKRFQREARAMARLDHENVIRVFDVGEEERSHYIVMEYFSGKDLKQLILEKKTFSQKDALSIALQVSDALFYAHSHGIIHRDIKPANIMVNRSGTVKIADFGIAAATDEVSVTATGHVIGTPEYMSPEQAKGEHLDGRSDLYSLGMVLYEMLTGETSYSGTSSMAILGKLVYEQKEFELTFSSDIPASIQDLIGTLLRKDRENRISDAKTLSGMIAKIADVLEDTLDPAETLEQTFVAEIPLQEPLLSPDDLSDETVMVSTSTSSSRTIGPPPPPAKSPKEEPIRKEIPDPPILKKESSLQVPRPLPEKIRSNPKWHLYVAGAAFSLIFLVGISSYFFFNKEEVNPIPATSSSITEIRDLEKLVRNIKKKVAISQKEAGTPDSLRLSGEIHDQAFDMENRGLKALEDAEKLIDRQNNQGAKEKLQMALSLFIRANEGYIKGKKTAAVRKLEEEKNAESARLAQEKREEERLERAKKDKEIQDREKLVSEKRARQKRERERLAREKRIRERRKKERLERERIERANRETPPARPDIEVVGELLFKLKTAYEKRDLKSLLGMSKMRRERARLLQQIFENYKIINVRISNVSVAGSSAQAVVSITKLTSLDGNMVLPSKRWKDAKLIIRKKGGRWGKVLW